MRLITMPQAAPAVVELPVDEAQQASRPRAIVASVRRGSSPWCAKRATRLRTFTKAVMDLASSSVIDAPSSFRKRRTASLIPAL
jgi:hypothetical protein